MVLVGTRNAGRTTPSTVSTRLGYGSREPAWSYDGASVGGIGIVSGDAWVEYTTPPRVYFTSRERSAGSGTLWCLTFDASSAAPCSGSWPVALGDIDGGPVVRSGVVYLGNNAGVVYAVNATTGAPIWSHADRRRPGQALGLGGLGCRTTSTQHRPRRSGRCRTPPRTWRWSHRRRPSPVRAAGGGHEVVVGSSDGRVHRLHASDGVEIGSPGWPLTRAGGAAVGSPAYDVGTDLVYVGTESGAVYAVS